MGSGVSWHFPQLFENLVCSVLEGDDLIVLLEIGVGAKYPPTLGNIEDMPFVTNLGPWNL